MENKETIYVVTYRIYGSIEIVRFKTFSQYINWQFALSEINKWHREFSNGYVAFEILSIKEIGE